MFVIGFKSENDRERISSIKGFFLDGEFIVFLLLNGGDWDELETATGEGLWFCKGKSILLLFQFLLLSIVGDLFGEIL